MGNKNEMRCFCTRHPLLAVYGVDDKGELYIHVKVYKQSRVYAELFISADAEVKIRCRECLRMHKIKIISGQPQLNETEDSMKLSPTNVAAAHVAATYDDGVR